ncbi:MAG: 30S ribosomal protein S13 [Patescibacteria group bacterium]|nr:MAG: 30S ribosomal protein S13 [Patescibacteria group bacterium]
MARIAGVTLPSTKRVIIALTYIYGIGQTQAKEIIKKTGVNPDTRIKDLAETEANKLRDHIEKTMKVEGELRRDTLAQIKRLKEIGSYRGTRHAKNLPMRGQRTKTNSRTTRGNVRKTMGSGRVKAGMKT